MKMKHCAKCGKVKPAEEFNRRQTSKDGKQSYCRSCQRGYNEEHEPIVQARMTELDGKFHVTRYPNGVTVYKHKDFKPC